MSLKAMTYEQTPVKKSIRIKSTDTDINRMTSLSILWYLLSKHKFGVVVTAFATYVAFTAFGTLIIGLLQSL